MEKLTEKQTAQVMQLFIGKVADIIGFDKCTELIRESKKELLTNKNKK